MEKHLQTRCQGCGSSLATIIEDYRYRGLRGTCQICSGNWPES